MFDLKHLHRPRSAEEAVRAFLETDGPGLYVAGGTIVVPTGSNSLEYLVDLTGAGLDYVRTEDTASGRMLVVGATTTMIDLVQRPELEGSELRALREAASQMGTHTIRNRATVGGNLFAAHFPSDLPPVMLALGARVTLQGRDGTREVALADFYGRRSEVYSRGDLIVDVRVPLGVDGLSSAFEKTGRTRVDVAILNCAAAVAVDGGVITSARLVLNGVSASPFVAEEAAGLLTGKPGSAELFEEAGALVVAGVEPRDDHRASGEYRRKVSGVIAARALTRAADFG